MVKQPKSRSSHRFWCISAGSAARPLWSAAPRWRLQARRPAAAPGSTEGMAGCSERSCGSALHWGSWWTTRSVAGRSGWLRSSGRAISNRVTRIWRFCGARERGRQWEEQKMSGLMDGWLVRQLDMHVWKTVKWDNGYLHKGRWTVKWLK